MKKRIINYIIVTIVLIVVMVYVFPWIYWGFIGNDLPDEKSIPLFFQLATLMCLSTYIIYTIIYEFIQYKK